MQSNLEEITEVKTPLNRMEDDIFCYLLIDVLISLLYGKIKLSVLYFVH